MDNSTNAYLSPLRDTSVNLRKKKALMLGMVFSTETRPLRGQEFRDRVRCLALDNSGYRVYSIDDKHEEDTAETNRHCTANFADANRMAKALRQRWGNDISFDLIVLDYFFSPSGWARTRWTENFFKKSLPLIAEEKLLSPNGTLWLPHVDHVDQMLREYRDLLSDHYDWCLVDNPCSNPLYEATEKVTLELERCPDNMTNVTQLRPLCQLEGGPFYEFRLKRRISTLASPNVSPKQAAFRSANSPMTKASSGGVTTPKSPSNRSRSKSPVVVNKFQKPVLGRKITLRS